MNSNHLLLVGSVVGATAAWVAWTEFKSESSDSQAHSPNHTVDVGSLPKSSGAIERSSNTRPPKQSPFIISELLTLDASASIQSSENLARLKSQSQRRLKQLEQSLFLDPNQSRQIYSLIARSSPLFTPGITINGAPASSLSPTSAVGEVHDLLDPSQQDDYVDDLLAEKEWWDDLVVELEAEIDADLTPTPPSSKLSPEKEIEETQTPFNLFKTLSE